MFNILLTITKIRHFTFENLSRAGAVNAIFTRRGGVSPSPWDSLNVGREVGDHPDRVAENHRRAFQSVGRAPASIVDVRQVHGANVVCFDQPPTPSTDAGCNPARGPEADALITNRSQLTLFMRFADCVPILLYDPVRGVVGMAHAGWRGTVKRVAAAAVTRMGSRFGSKPEDVIAGIGPSICIHHYEVGDEVARQVQESFGDKTSILLRRQDGRVKFDLCKANRMVLEGVGVRNIEAAGICTACCPEDWFSYRAENGRTGRFGALIGLQQ